jgi:hypothetical protein
MNSLQIFALRRNLAVQAGVKEVDTDGLWIGDDTALGKLQGMNPVPRFHIQQHDVKLGLVELHFYDLEVID